MPPLWWLPSMKKNSCVTFAPDPVSEKQSDERLDEGEEDEDEKEDEEDEENSDSSIDSGRRIRAVRAVRSFSLVPERLGFTLERENAGMYPTEIAMKYFSFLALLLTFPISIFFCFKVVAQYERCVVFRLGRLLSSEARGPGLVFQLPCLDSVKRVDLRTFTFDVPTQEVLTKDSVTVAVDAVVYYRIFDPVMSVVNVEDPNRSTKLLAQTTLRNVLGTVDLYQLLAAREQIAGCMHDCLDSATDTWGVKVERVDIKDVRLPLQLQRAMAAEAEATREAKAKVIAAEGEESSSRPLRIAAQELGKCAIALQLRYLQTLSSISTQHNSTIIFPLPFDFLSHLPHKKSPLPLLSPAPPRLPLPSPDNDADDSSTTGPSTAIV